MSAPPPMDPITAKLQPGAGPFRPFPGGPWFQVTPQGVLQIYANGAWTSAPQSLPNTTLPNQPPPRYGPPPGNFGPSLMAGAALYISLSNLWDAIRAVQAEDAVTQTLYDQGTVLGQQLARAEEWNNWLFDNPLGQQLRGAGSCMIIQIGTAQAEITRLQGLTPVNYEQIVALQGVINAMEAHQAFVRDLRTNFIVYGGDLPGYDAVNSVVCYPLPLEQAPLPTEIVPDPNTGTVPDYPTQGGPLFPPNPSNPSGPLFPTPPEAVEND